MMMSNGMKKIVFFDADGTILDIKRGGLKIRRSLKKKRYDSRYGRYRLYYGRYVPRWNL